MPTQANTRRRTSNSCKCSQRRKCTVLRKHGAGTTGLGLPRLLSNGVGNSVCRLGYCLRKLMLLVSNATPRYPTLAVFLRIIDEGNNLFPFLMRFTVYYGVQEPLLGRSTSWSCDPRDPQKYPCRREHFQGLFVQSGDRQRVCQ
jgi:hypothetical protein